MVEKLRCDVKKLELNLKLVDSDNMSTEDYNKLREEIISICGINDKKPTISLKIWMLKEVLIC